MKVPRAETPPPVKRTDDKGKGKGKPKPKTKAKAKAKGGRPDSPGPKAKA